jgi:organic radical activating enzyme
MKYPVVETFQSIQGEGRFIGYPVNFIRLAGCSMGCDFCDTDILARESLTEDELVARMNSEHSSVVVLTGGEPLEQNIKPLVDALQLARYRVHLETNGALPIPLDYLNYVSMSPKKTKRPATCNFYKVDEVKWLVPLWSLDEILAYINAGSVLPVHYVQPVNDKLTLNPIATAQAIDYVKKSNGQLKLSIQLHKVIGVR